MNAAEVRTVAVLGAVAAVYNALARAVLRMHAPWFRRASPLRDVLHVGVSRPARDAMSAGVDAVIALSVLALAGCCLRGHLPATEVAWSVVLGYSARSLLVVVTLMPPPAENVCGFPDKPSMHGQCGELMYSGHAFILSLSMLWLCRANLVDRGTAGVIVAVCLLFVVLARNHYTSDVLVSMVAAVAAANV